MMRRLFGLLAVVVVVSACAITDVLPQIIPPSHDAPIPDASLERYAGIPQNTTDEGFPQLGDPKAPVHITEYSSYDCTHCADFHSLVFINLIDRVRAGEVVYTYVPLYGTGSIANGQGAARAALCAGEQSSFWEYHDALYEWQTLYNQEAFTYERLVTGAENLGLDRLAFEQCFEGDTISGILDSAYVAAGQLEDFVGTPTVVINDVMVSLDKVSAAIDEALAASDN
jgi:protein-disulfide isomerase